MSLTWSLEPFEMISILWCLWYTPLVSILQRFYCTCESSFKVGTSLNINFLLCFKTQFIRLYKRLETWLLPVIDLLLVFMTLSCYFRLFFVWPARQLVSINSDFQLLFLTLEREAFRGYGSLWLLPFWALLTLGNLWCQCLLRFGYTACFHFYLFCVLIFTLYEQKDVAAAVNLTLSNSLIE